MIGAIPNPTKSLTIQFPLDQVKIAARNIDKVMSFCHFREENDIFNSYKFSRTEFLSFGAIINVHLKKIDDLTTQIDIEISRQMGAFDDWVEVSKANRHLDETMKAISEILTNGVPQKQTEVTSEVGKISDKKVSVVEAWATIIGVLVGLGGFLWIISLAF
jgi:hypothetical protein